MHYLFYCKSFKRGSMRAFVPVFEYKIIIGSGYVKYTLPISLCNAKHKNAKGTYFFLLNSAVYLSALRKEERIIYIFFFLFLLLHQSPNLSLPKHKTCRDFYSSWSCIEWWSDDRWRMIFLLLFYFIFLYLCYYPHSLKYSVSPVCGMFSEDLNNILDTIH